MVFYLMAAVIVPLAGATGLAAILRAAEIAFHLIDMSWYLAILAKHHGEFFAGALAFLMRDRLRLLGFAIPGITGVALIAYFAVIEKSQLLPFGLFFFITAFSNLNPQRPTRAQAALERLGEVSYSMYSITRWCSSLPRTTASCLDCQSRRQSRQMDWYPEGHVCVYHQLEIFRETCDRDGQCYCCKWLKTACAESESRLQANGLFHVWRSRTSHSLMRVTC